MTDNFNVPKQSSDDFATYVEGVIARSPEVVDLTKSLVHDLSTTGIFRGLSAVAANEDVVNDWGDLDPQQFAELADKSEASAQQSLNAVTGLIADITTRTVIEGLSSADD